MFNANRRGTEVQKMRNLILLILFVAVTNVNAASSPAVSTAAITAANTAAMYHVMHSNRMTAEHGISKVFRNEKFQKLILLYRVRCIGFPRVFLKLIFA